MIMIMKNFNRRSFHGGHGSKRRELAELTRTLTWVARIHSHTYINIIRNTWCEAPAQLLQNFENRSFILKVPEGIVEGRGLSLEGMGRGLGG